MVFALCSVLRGTVPRLHLHINTNLGFYHYTLGAFELRGIVPRLLMHLRCNAGEECCVASGRG